MLLLKNGESFVLKSLPSTTNITLLDPDDNLLVDTDFDGTYEDSTLEFTSNEIRFKFKTRSNLTYEFYSYQIDGISFTHNYSNVNATGESVFVPIVTIKDYKLSKSKMMISSTLDELSIRTILFL